MTVPAGLTNSDLDRIEPDHGPLRLYRVTLVNDDTKQSETYEIEAADCAKAKGMAICMMRMRLLGSPLLNDVVRISTPCASKP